MWQYDLRTRQWRGSPEALRLLGRAEVVVYDKGQIPGGRLASRRTDRIAFEPDWHFVSDHGAQYFTARDPEFHAQVRAWQGIGLVAEWRARLLAIDADGRQPVSVDEPRWVAVPGMRKIGRAHV